VQIDAYGLIYEMAAIILFVGAMAAFFVKGKAEVELTQEQHAMLEAG
jgi:hypothetical protein